MSKENDEYVKLNSVNKNIFILIPLIVLSLLIAYFGWFHDEVRSQESFGQFGDYFGGILNPILSFCVIALLIHSTRLQASELAETRKELKLSRKVQKKHAKSTKEQSMSFKFSELSTSIDRHLNLIEELLSKESVFFPVFFSAHFTGDMFLDNDPSKESLGTNNGLEKFEKKLLQNKLEYLETYQKCRISLNDIQPVCKGYAYSFIFKEEEDGPEVECLKELPNLIETALYLYHALEQLGADNKGSIGSLECAILRHYRDKINILCMREVKYIDAFDSSNSEISKKINKFI